MAEKMTLSQWVDKFVPNKKDDDIEALLIGFKRWLYNQPEQVWNMLPKKSSGKKVWWDFRVVFDVLSKNGVKIPNWETNEGGKNYERI